MGCMTERQDASAFAWRDRFMVGHPVIDGGHRDFFVGISWLSAHLDAGGEELDVEAEFRALANDLLRHCADEERILAEIGCTDLAAHTGSHRGLSHQAEAVLTIGRDGAWGTALRLLSILVLEHIAEEDVKIQPWLARTGSGSPPPH